MPLYILDIYCILLSDISFFFHYYSFNQLVVLLLYIQFQFITIQNYHIVFFLNPFSSELYISVSYDDSYSFFFKLF